MSTTIDNRVVEMTFDNRDFEKNVSQSIKTLDSLDKALNFKDAGKSFDSLSKAADKVNFRNLHKDLDETASKFSFLEQVGIGFFRSLGSRLEEMAHNFSTTFTGIASTITGNFNAAYKAVTQGVFFEGWGKMESMATSTRTIMAATADSFKDEGEQLEYVNDKLSDLLWYADETSYSFTDMTNNVGKFTAQKIPLEQATEAMIGISNWAAISGQGTNEAARAMYNLAQSLGMGSVQLRDWMSIENANMATAQFKQTVLETGKNMGLLREKSKGVYEDIATGAEITVKSFRENLKKDWFSNELLMASLEKYGHATMVAREVIKEASDARNDDFYLRDLLHYVDDYADALEEGDVVWQQQILSDALEDTGIEADKLKDYFDELTKSENALGIAALKAGYETTTLSQAIDYTKDAAGSAWMRVFNNLAGDYLQQVSFFTEMVDDLYTIFVEPIDRIGSAASLFSEVMGASLDTIPMHMDVLLQLGDIIGEILTQFRDGLFGEFTREKAWKLADVVVRIHQALEKLYDTIRKSKSVETFFTGVRSVLTTIWQVLSGLFGTAKALLSFVSPIFKLLGEGLKFIVDKIFGLSEATNKSRAIPRFFEKIQNALYKAKFYLEVYVARFRKGFINAFEKAWPVIKKVAEVISGPFILAWKAVSWLFTNAISPALSFIWDKIKVFGGFLGGVFATASEKIANIWAELEPVFKEVGSYIGGAFTTVWEQLGETWDTIYPKLQEIWGTIKEIASQIGGHIKEIWNTLFPKKEEGQPTLFDRLFGSKEGEGEESENGIVKFFKNLRDTITDADGPVQWVLDRLTDLKNLIMSGWENGGKETVLGALNLIKGAFEKIKEFGSGAIQAVKDFFGSFSGTDDTTGVEEGGEKLEKAGEKVNIFANALETLRNVASKVKEIIEKVIRWLLDTLGGEGATFVDVLNGIGSGATLIGIGKLLNSVSGITDQMSAMMEKFSGISKEGIADKIKKVVDSVTSLAKAIVIIIAAVVAAIFILKDSSQEDIDRGLSLITNILKGILIFTGAMKLMKVDISISDNIKKLGAAFVEIGAALWLMARVIKKLGKLKPEELDQGITGLKKIMLMLGIFALVISGKSMQGTLGNSSGVTRGFSASSSMPDKVKGLIAAAAACYILVLAVSKLCKVINENPNSYGKAVDTLFGIMAILGIFVLLTKNYVSSNGSGAVSGGAAGIGFALIEFAAAVAILALVVKQLSTMDDSEMAHGIKAMLWISGMLVLMAAVMAAITSEEGSGGRMIAGAASLLLIVAALAALAVVVVMLGKVGWDKLEDGLLAMAVALGILMAAAALATLFAPGLYALAAVFAALGVAVLFIGLGIDLLAKGLMTLMAVLAMIAVMGPAGMEAILVAINAFLDGLGTIVSKLALLFVEVVVSFVEGLAALSGRFFTAVSTLVVNLLTTIIEAVTQLIEPLKVLVQTLLNAIIDIVFTTLDVLLDRLIEFLLHCLDVLAEKAPDFMEKTADIILAILQGLEDNIPRIVDKLIETGIVLIQTLADAFDPNKEGNTVPELLKAVDDLLSNIIKTIVEWAKDIFNSGLELLKELWDGLTGGLTWDEIKEKAHEIVTSIVDGIGSWMSDVLNAGKSLLNKIWEGLTGKSDGRGKDLGNSIANEIQGQIEKDWDVNSPSKKAEWTGEMYMQGLENGLKNGTAGVIGTISDIELNFSDMFSNISSLISGIFSDGISDPVVRPTLDLSEVISGANSINDLLGGNTINVAGMFEETGGLTGDEWENSPNGVTFIQNNYSPKSLSRLDIYRQTQNQLSTIKGVVHQA